MAKHMPQPVIDAIAETYAKWRPYADVIGSEPGAEDPMSTEAPDRIDALPGETAGVPDES